MTRHDEISMHIRTSVAASAVTGVVVFLASLGIEAMYGFETLWFPLFSAAFVAGSTLFKLMRDYVRCPRCKISLAKFVQFPACRLSANLTQCPQCECDFVA